VQYQVPIRIRDGDQVSTKEKQLIALLVFIAPPVSSLPPCRRKNKNNIYK
jgi:hypothetical protein